MELAVGYSILAYLGVDYLFNKLNSREKQRIMHQLRFVVHTDELKKMAIAVSDVASKSMIASNVVQADAGDVKSYHYNNHPYSYHAFGNIDEIADKESDEKKSFISLSCSPCTPEF